MLDINTNMIKNMSKEQRIEVYQALVSRAQLIARLGQQYGNDRDIYEALGYPTTITFSDYSTRYTRQDMAKAVIDRPVDGTWRNGFVISEPEDKEETPFEAAWAKLEKTFGVSSRFHRVDKLTSLGKYGVLFFGLDDVQTSDQFKAPVNQGERKLLYLKPFSEQSATIKNWETSPKDPRYGLPTMYEISIRVPGSDRVQTVLVHHSRVIHITQELLEDEADGTPQLQVVYNRLFDLEKLVGGSAEMFWRGARPGYQGMINTDYQLDTDTEDDLQDQLDEYENNLRRILMLEGVELKALTPQISDPSTHVDVQIQMISAVTGIPKRILTGSERGELASTEDRGNWFDKLQTRREQYAEPSIIRPFVDRCVELGVLPEPGATGYSVEWPDLYAPSEEEKAGIGKTRSEALANYAKDPSIQSVVTPEAFLQYFLGFDEDQVTRITEMMEAAQLEEDADFDDIEE